MKWGTRAAPLFMATHPAFLRNHGQRLSVYWNTSGAGGLHEERNPEEQDVFLVTAASWVWSERHHKMVQAFVLLKKHLSMLQRQVHWTASLKNPVQGGNPREATREILQRSYSCEDEDQFQLREHISACVSWTWGLSQTLCCSSRSSHLAPAGFPGWHPGALPARCRLWGGVLENSHIPACTHLWDQHLFCQAHTPSMISLGNLCLASLHYSIRAVPSTPPSSLQGRQKAQENLRGQAQKRRWILRLYYGTGCQGAQSWPMQCVG